LFRQGRFTPFDALEFNPNLRWIDMANDIAFLVMDLLARGRPDLAYTVLNGWLETTGDYDSLAVMRFYLVYRSMVRAVVTAIRRRQSAVAAPGESARPEAERYVELAAGLVDTPPARLVLMHGFSGSGKTWRSGQLVAGLPALRVRSDLERKRLTGLDASQRRIGDVGSGLYAPDITDRTYDRMAECCAMGLRAGFDMIADATFLRREHREQFRQLAVSLGAGFAIVDCSAPREVLEARIRERAARRQDASDADLAVLHHQLSHHEPLSASERSLIQEFPSDSNSG